MSSLFTALLLMIWMRIIPIRTIELIANPLLAVPCNQADRMLGLVRPAFGRRATRPFVAAVLLILLLTLRGAAHSAMDMPWTLTVGPAIFIPNLSSPLECILFSFLSFGWLIERMWVVVLLFGWLRRYRPVPLEEGFANAISSPISSAPRWQQLIIVILFCIVLSHATISAGFGCSVDALLSHLPATTSETTRELYRISMEMFPSYQTTTPMGLALMLVGTFSGAFSAALDACVAFIIASIIGLIFRWTYWNALGNAGMSYFVGTFFRRPVRLGNMNFAPLVYLVLSGLISFALYVVGTTLVLFIGGAFTPEVQESFRQVLEAMP